MEKGRFSQPRPYRDEERQIEEAFKQVTQQKHPPRHPVPPAAEDAVTDETMVLPPEQRVPEIPEIPDLRIPDLEIPEAQIPEPELSQKECPPPPVQAPQPPTEDIPVPPPPAQSADPRPIEEVISQQILKSFPEDVPQQEPFPEEEAQYQGPMGFRDLLLDFIQENRKPFLLGGCALIVLVLLAVIGITAVSRIPKGQTDDRILNNVYIAGVNVGGMTKSQAVSAVKQATMGTYSVQDMVVNIGGTSLHLSPKDTGASLDVKAAVDAAYDYGRTGTQADREIAQGSAHTVGLLPYLKLNTDYIRQELTRHSGETGSALTQASYGLEGKYPSLSAKDFDPKAAQTLVLTMGTPGVSFDVDTVYNQVLDAYSLHIFQVEAEGVLPAVEPDPVDLKAIYDEFYVAPKDSTLDNKTFEVIPGSYGYEFDMEAAQKLVDAAGYGDVLRIPMVFITPELMDETILFRDVLGECQTPLSGTQNRITNIKLACKAMDGTVLQPGETFSYNSCLGERTAAKGYKPAPAYSGNELVDSLGGGICQGSTTLYYSALLADMEIVSRTNHGFPVSYIDYGMDATVSWGGPDFQFRNSSRYPVKIQASVSGNYLSIQILGTEERDYFVKMDYSITNVHDPVTEYEEYPHDNAEGYKDGDVIQEGVTGYSVKTYKLKYSRSTGKLISKDFEANSRYTTVNKIVAKVAPEPTVPETTVPETTVPETTVPETTVPETTVPETTAPPEPTVPETTPPEPTTPETTPPPATQPQEEPQSQEEPQLPAAA